MIDNGAASFVPISEYLLRNEIAEMLAEAGRHVVVHTIVTGGAGMLDTIKGFSSLVENFPATVPVVVWLNELFGPVLNASGKPFEDLSAYTANRDRIAGLVRLNALRDDAAHDLQDMIAKHQTFAQALAPENATILRVQKSRLFKIRQALWPQIGAVL